MSKVLFFSGTSRKMSAMLNRVLPVLLCVLLLPGGMPVRGDEPKADSFDDALILEIHALHEQSVNGDKRATRVLVQKLEGLTKQYPDKPLLLAYLGSAYTLASRDAWPGPSKFSFLKNGLATMDRAVNADPLNIPVRFIRAVNNFRLPAFICRRDNARADFAILTREIEAKPGVVDNRVCEAIYYYAGLSFKQLSKIEEARSCWGKGLALHADPDYTDKIARELARL